MYRPFTNEFKTPALNTKSLAGSLITIGFADDGITSGYALGLSILKNLSDV